MHQCYRSYNACLERPAAWLPVSLPVAWRFLEDSRPPPVKMGSAWPSQHAQQLRLMIRACEGTRTLCSRIAGTRVDDEMCHYRFLWCGASQMISSVSCSSAEQSR